MDESFVHFICAVEFSDFITKFSAFDNVRLTLLRWCIPGRKTSVVLEWREWLELVANWERVTHGFTVQWSDGLVVML